MIRLLAALLLLAPSVAAADRVTVKGAVLEGKVKSISAKQVVMETIYGKGDLTIKTEDVSAIETDAPFHVYKADDGVNVGRVVGISPAAVTVAENGTLISSIVFGVPLLRPSVLRVSPVGSRPSVTSQLYGGTPPVATSWSE